MKTIIALALMFAAACMTDPTSDVDSRSSKSATGAVIDVSKMTPDSIKMFRIIQPRVNCSQTFCTPYACTPTEGGMTCDHDTSADLQCSFTECDDGFANWCDDAHEASDTLHCDSICSGELPNNPDGYSDCLASCMNQIRRHCVGSNVFGDDQ